MMNVYIKKFMAIGIHRSMTKYQTICTLPMLKFGGTKKNKEITNTKNTYIHMNTHKTIA